MGTFAIGDIVLDRDALVKAGFLHKPTLEDYAQQRLKMPRSKKAQQQILDGLIKNTQHEIDNPGPMVRDVAGYKACLAEYKLVLEEQLAALFIE